MNFIDEKIPKISFFRHHPVHSAFFHHHPVHSALKQTNKKTLNQSIINNAEMLIKRNH